MRSVSFDGCFGWLHTAPGDVATDVAVVMCPALKDDGRNGYRSFRRLADALAKAGYPTLRFDYPGTGDSYDPGLVEFWSVWRQSIHAAIDWMREHSGAKRIVLCGLRIGATLATTVAPERSDVCGLVLLAPILRGRSYILQLTIEAQLRRGRAAAEEGLEIDELLLSGDTVKLINKLDLREAVLPPGLQVALYSQTPSPVLNECAAAWRKGGATVVCEDFTGLEAMLRPSFMSHAAPADTALIVGWMRAALAPGETLPQQARAPASAEIRLARCVETPLHFGPMNNLFGVLCRPSVRQEPDLAVVIGNSGGDPHHGTARVSVDLARRLAAEGIASLRMDYAGLGDSLAPGDAETHVFESDRRPDITAAIDALAAQGYRRFGVQGLCTGAYHAFHAALAETRISVVMLVNLPMFQWPIGDKIEDLVLMTPTPIHSLRKLRGKDVWRRLRRGWPALRSVIVGQIAWFGQKGSDVAWRLARLAGRQPPPSFARDSMRQLSLRARTQFLFAERDGGVVALAREFGPNMAPPGAALRIIPGVDHILTGGEARRVVAEYMIELLKYGSASHVFDRSGKSANMVVSASTNPTTVA